jgi:hypothetical protein
MCRMGGVVLMLMPVFSGVPSVIFWGVSSVTDNMAM